MKIAKRVMYKGSIAEIGIIQLPDGAWHGYVNDEYIGPYGEYKEVRRIMACVLGRSLDKVLFYYK